MKPDKNNKNSKRNMIGLVSIILWALFFTILLRSCQSAYENADTVQVPYTTFREWLVEDKIQQVNMETGLYTFTLREGVTVELPKDQTDQSQSWMSSILPSNQKPEDVKYVTVPLATVDDTELLSLLEEHLPDGGDAYTKPVDSSTYLLSLFLSYILPLVVMVGLMLFLFRGVGGKGGMGGIGGVGKSNAKVYVEKKTGVTFRDVACQDEAKE